MTAFLQSSCFQTKLHIKGNYSIAAFPPYLSVSPVIPLMLGIFLTFSFPCDFFISFISMSLCRHSCRVFINTLKLDTTSLHSISAFIKLSKCLFQNPYNSSLPPTSTHITVLPVTCWWFRQPRSWTREMHGFYISCAVVALFAKCCLLASESVGTEDNQENNMKIPQKNVPVSVKLKITYTMHWMSLFKCIMWK